MNLPTYSGRRDDTTTYFSGKTESYQRHRPGYPREAIEYVLRGLPETPVVADIGCGTGISTRLLAAAGARVIGIDPNEEMLAAARAMHRPSSEPTIEYHIGSGEATGLDAHSIDCVVCAQAFHWFDRERALQEFHRILTSGGRLALLWNKRDERDDASAEYERIIARAMDIAESTGRVVARFRSAPCLRPWFEQSSAARFGNPAEYSRDDLVGRARSSSYWPDAGANRDALEADLYSLSLRFERAGVLRLEQFTDVTLARAL